MTNNTFPVRPQAPWQERLATVLETMREISRQTDPQATVKAYAARMQRNVPRDRLVTLSRRDQSWPEIRVTRDSARPLDIDPWKERQRLPVVRGGLLAELIYANAPRIINDLRIDAADPGAAYLEGQRSLLAIPLFDAGEALNMVVFLRHEPSAFRWEDLPEQVLMSNLFGRATASLVLSAQLREAYRLVDRELEAVAQIQRSLLPQELPRIPTLELAAYYETSRRAGGDYYDLFPLPDGCWGILIADVSGHGTPAAVMMAVTHALAHTHPEPPSPPGRLLTRLNRQLTVYYTHGMGTFVTAFYGLYDPATRKLTYAVAGHNPPRLRRCTDGGLLVLNGARGMPLGVLEDSRYREAVQELRAGDQLVLYTDGITEAFNAAGEMFGTERLDGVLANCSITAEGLVQEVVAQVKAFAGTRAADDDRTVLAMKVI